MSAENWRPIEFSDIPDRQELKQITLDCLRQGITNSDKMRSAITTPRGLIVRTLTGRWNSSPSGKFINEHAWVLADLVQRREIENVSEKEYRLPRA